MLDIYFTDEQLDDVELAELTLNFRERGGGATAQEDGRTMYSVHVKYVHRIFSLLPYLLSKGLEISGDLTGLLAWIKLPKASWDNEVPSDWVDVNTPAPTTDDPKKTRTKEWQEYSVIHKGLTEGLILCQHSIVINGMREQPTFAELKRFVNELLDGDYTKLITGEDYTTWMEEFIKEV